MLITKEYYIIKASNKYLVQHSYHDFYMFSEDCEKAKRFPSRQSALDFMKLENIKGLVYKVFYKELRSD